MTMNGRMVLKTPYKTTKSGDNEVFDRMEYSIHTSDTVHLTYMCIYTTGKLSWEHKIM